MAKSLSSDVADRLSNLSIQSPVDTKILGWFCPKCTKLLAMPIKKDVKPEDHASTGWVLHYSTIKALTAVANQGCQLCFIILQSNCGYVDKARVPDTAIWLQRGYSLESEDEYNSDDGSSIVNEDDDDDVDDKNDNKDESDDEGLDENQVTQNGYGDGDGDDDSDDGEWMLDQNISIKWVTKRINGAKVMTSETTVASAIALPTYPTDLKACESTADIDLKPWFTTCLNEHSCEKDRKPGYLPKRLLECTGQGLRLVDSQSIEKDVRYAALSYSWGTSPTHLTLTTENMTKLENGILDADLPLTFSDAAKVALGLDIKYIWIDSLCIIQSGDNGEDWLNQVGEMHNIYSSCVLQIAASHSTNAFGGCFFKRPKGGQRPTIVSPAKFVNMEVPKNGDKPALLIPSSGDILNFYLDTRGWVFQERLLAPRTVHFDKDDVYWECYKCKCSASYLLGEQTLHSDIRKGVSQEYNWQEYNWRRVEQDDKLDAYAWGEMVNEYSKRNLTVPEDRLIAFSSIAQRVCEHYNDDYIAGFCRSLLPQALLWYCSDGVKCGPEYGKFQTNMCFNNYGVPTWSWGSVNNEIYFSSISNTKAELVSADVKLADESRKYGLISNASITLRAPVFYLDIKCFKGTDLPTNRIMFQGSILLIDDIEQADGCLDTREPDSIAYYASIDNGIWPDEDENAEYKPNPSFRFNPDKSADYAHVDIWKNVICLVIEADGDSDGTEKVAEEEIRGLILVPLDSGAKMDIKYVRIGEFNMSAVSEKGTSPVNGMEVMEITIV
jgi:hypothetical protein